MALNSSWRVAGGPCGHGLTVGSMFSGIGGFCLGFREAGFDIVWAVDAAAKAAAVYAANHPGTRMVKARIESLSAADLEPVDILLAGFPCQPFSTLGKKRGFDDPRADTFVQLMRLIGEYGPAKPKMLILENVFGLVSHDSGRTFARVISEIKALGYITWWDIISAAAHAAWPQNRRRLFIVAVDEQLNPATQFRFPPQYALGMPPHIDTLLDLHKKADDRHYLQPGTKRYADVEAVMNALPGYRFYHRRISGVQPFKKPGIAPTLTAVPCDEYDYLIRDSWGIRALTVDELMRIQGFDPASFTWPGNVSILGKRRLIGNAVCVPVSRLLAAETVHFLEREEIIYASSAVPGHLVQ